MSAVIAPPVHFFTPMGSRLPRSGDTRPLTHALRIPFATAGQAMRAAGRFQAAVRSCWPAAGQDAADQEQEPRLWLEDVAAASASPLAARRREAELTRVIGPALKLPVRAVLLRYTDDRADMIVACYRAFGSEATLRHLATLLTGTADEAVPPPGGQDREQATAGLGQEAIELWPAPPWAGPAWGFGSDAAGDQVASFRLPLGGDQSGGDAATWLVALAVVLARYDDEPSPVAALVPAWARLGAGQDQSCWPVLMTGQLDDDIALGDLVARVRAELTRPGNPGWPSAPADLAAPVAGLLFTAGCDAPGGREAPVEYSPCQAPVFPLTISVTLRRRSASLRCDYRLRCFDPAVVRQFAWHLARVHRQVIETPQRQAAEAELLDAHERGRVAALGRPPQPLRTQPACVHELVAAHARARPDSPALSDGAQRLSYAELDARSDRLAHGLRALGVRDGDRVGTCLERSADLVVTLLGVLKAGAVYVPMDPDYPADRLSYTVHDAAIGLVVAMPGQFPAGDVKVVTPAELAELGDGAPPGPPPGDVTAADPAYVIYTSGSTGRPKGCVVPHANVVALVDATREEYRLTESDVWTLFHSSAFDFSVWEIWGCLLTGAHLVVVPFWISRSPDEFRALLAAEKVTVLSQTPSAFGQLLTADRGDPADLAVRLIVFGGEALDARMLLRWFDRHPESGCRVVNMFGITETTVHVTAETLTRRHALERSRSVGHPLPGWHVYVMDSRQRIAPLGVAGEIYVGGAGVSLGYLNQAELTSQRFVADPFTGERMYRSGDKGRLRPDGKLEHLGRLDSQVKVRGFRIELDEIRMVLLESPGVTAAAAVVNTADPADPASARIDAYVVLADGAGPAGVRRRVAGILPGYMVPATVTPLPALPLTTNGKLDTARLPAPDLPEDAPAAAEPTAAKQLRDFSEDLLAAWAHALRTRVGLDDDFFELGGNSLCAVRITAAMRDQGWPRIPIRDIYRNPTIRQLAACMGHPIT
jgi:amino acid adenylation domain-containing protein